MNEEDKKIINKLRQTIDFNSDLYIDDLGDNDIKDILNLIARQQKEIEELNTELEIRIKWQQYFEKEYINKDKIRDKIKEARKIRWHIPKLVIDYFEELLEEN